MVIDRVALAHSTFNRACLAGLLAWTASSAALAADAPLIASGSASITGFQYELVNLAATPGGPAPWINFDTDSGATYGSLLAFGTVPVSAQNVPLGEYEQWDGVMPTTALKGISSDGLAQAQASPTSMSVTASLPANLNFGDLPSIIQIEATAAGGSEDGRNWGYSVMGANGAVLDYEGGPNPDFNFTLSAHTALVLRGHASAAMSFNPEVSPWPVASIGAVVQARASMSLSFAEAMKPLPESYPDQQSFVKALTDAYGYVTDGVAFDWTVDGTGTHGPASKDIVLTLTNDSDHEVTGTMNLTTQMLLNLTADPNAPVPEPGAPLMVSLGLVVVWASRRRTPASA